MAKNAKMIENRPWGKFVVLSERKEGKQDIVEKRLEILPGARISYQLHKNRSEDWVIISGHGTLTLNDEDIKVEKGDPIHIPMMTKHRIRNDSKRTLLIIHETATGIFDELDIVRFDDDFDRDSDWKNS